ncbi:translocation/assembly module TamB domain-containing protein [uncultured Rikenella sp.]|uniref:translocation/assembly module TamB domain-containing protein n=1 Tax=uncultured Rikenella sp. TaxID=368003 RepID=UPI002634AA52|nr:translocation/assembly module TamB domain-containing protein [uncultured Rikenella sp.]
MIRKIVKYTLRVLAILLGLALLLFATLYLPPVQDFIRKKTSAYISEKFGMQLSVERLRLKFPLQLAVDDAQAVAETGDTLFAFRTLRADISLLPLLRKEVVVKQFTFGDASFHMADTLGAVDLKVRLRELALEADHIDLGAQEAHVPAIRLSGGDVRLTMGQAQPDTIARDTAATPMLWKIVAEKIELDSIAFTMRTTSPAVSDLTARIRTGKIDSCTVDIGTRNITAAGLLIEKGNYAYLTGRNTVPAEATPVLTQPEETATGLPWTVNAAKIRLKDNAARYGSLYGTPAKGFDPNHIAVSDLNLSLDSLFNRGTTIRAILAELTFTERSGLAVTQAQGRIGIDSAGYTLRDFRIETTASTLRAGVQVGAGIASMEPTAPVDIRLTATLGTADIFRLVETGDTLRRKLAGRDLTTNLNLSGTLGDLRLTGLTFSLPAVLDFAARGRIRSLTEPRNAAGAVTFEGALLNPELPAAFLPAGVALPPIQLRGRAEARAGLYSGNLTLLAAEGTLQAEGSFDPKEKQYRADAKIDSLPLFRFLPADSLGYLTLSLRAKGDGFDIFSARTAAQAEVRIAQAEYRGFDYSDIELTARIADNRIEGGLTSGNAALNADLRLGGLLTRQRQEASVTGRIRTLDFGQMHFSAIPASISALLDVQASATDAKAYAAQVTLDTLRVGYGKSDYWAMHTTLSAWADTARVEAGIASGDLKLDFRSNAGLDSLTAALTRTAAEVSRQIRAGCVDADTLGELLPPFRLEFRAARNNLLQYFSRSQGMGFGRASLTASAGKEGPFGLQAEVDGYSTRGMVLDTLTAGIGGRGGQLRYSVRIANRRANKNPVGQLALSGRARGNTAIVNLSQRDREGRQGLDFGLQATLQDSSVTVNLLSDNPVFGAVPWSVNRDNYVRYGFDRTLAVDLWVTRPGQSFSLLSAQAEDMPSGSIRLALMGIGIGGVLKILPAAPPLDGRVGADLMFGMADDTIAARGRLTIDTLRYDDRRVGDIGLNLAYRTDTLSGHAGSLSLLVDRRTALTAEGRYRPADSASTVELRAEIPGIPLAAANPFLPEGSGSLSGMLKGHLEAGGSVKALGLNGSLKFDSTAVDVAAIGTRFGVTDNPIVLEQSKVRFNDFGLIAPNKRRLTVNGSLDLTDFSRMTADLQVQGRDFRLIDVPRSRGSMVFGQASADLSARVQGPVDALNIRGDANLLTGTEVTYVMQDSPMGIKNQSQSVVNFIAFDDTTTVYAVRPPAMLNLGGIDMLMNVAIDPAVQVSVYLSEDGQNRIDLQGGGNLTYSMNRLGDTRFAGKYELSGGRVRYSPPVISAKDFSITPGGYVNWTGDIADPSFSVRAVETIRTTVTMEDQTSRQVNFQIIIAISGTLDNLDVKFDLAAQEDLTLQNQLASLTPEQRQNQAMSLLIYNTYSGPGTSAKVNTGNPINSFIAKELNQWAQNSLKGVDLSFGVDSYDDLSAGPDGTRTDYSYKLSKKFFDNRVRVAVGGKVSTGGDPNQNAAENLVDDISLEYQLTRRDNMYIKVFRETNFESILEGEVTETGVGFGVRKKILKLGDLFRLTKEKKEVKAERKAARKERREEKRKERQAERGDVAKTGE